MIVGSNFVNFTGSSAFVIVGFLGELVIFLGLFCSLFSCRATPLYLFSLAFFKASDFFLNNSSASISNWAVFSRFEKFFCRLLNKKNNNIDIKNPLKIIDAINTPTLSLWDDFGENWIFFEELVDGEDAAGKFLFSSKTLIAVKVSAKPW